MVSVSDILKILDRIPVWQTLKTMPARMEALEKRVAELEAAAKKPAKPERMCEICGEPMKATQVREEPTFGMFGVKLIDLECPNGHTDTERREPPKQQG